MVDPDDLDQNYFRSQGLISTCSEIGSSRETEHVHLRSCGVPLAEFNIAHLKTPVRDLDAALAEARAFFAEQGLPFRITIRESLAAPIVDALESHGFQAMRAVHGMALDPIRDGAREVPELQVRRVVTEIEIADFQRTAFAGFGFAPEGAAKFLTAKLLDQGSIAGFVGYCNGIPASTALLSITDAVAGIYFVATLKAFRKRGFGERLTWAATQEGMTRGCRRASLQASEMGRPVYARMGFKASGDYVELQQLNS